MLLPQAWSLGLELMFYIIIPFVLIFGLRLPLALMSVVIFLTAYAGLINADWFSYRLLPGTFFIFILGSWISHSDKKFSNNILTAAYILFGVLFVGATFWWKVSQVTYDVIIGLLLGLPVVFMLSRLPSTWKLGSLALDGLAGDLSYGVFLNHNLVIFGMKYYFTSGSEVSKFIVSMLVSTVMSYVSFYAVEKPLILVRRQMRNRVTAMERLSPPKVACR
jgi:peptidoglycan/LPS O-acetylase OafA/YrhL